MEKGLSKLLNWCNFSAIYVALVAQWIEQWIPNPKLAKLRKPMFSDINLFSLAFLRSDLVGKC